MTGDLFATHQDEPYAERLGDCTVWLHGFAYNSASALVRAIEEIAREAPFRQMITPGGFRMSAAMTNCGRLGWVTDRTGYRYTEHDPQTARRWPEMPDCLLELATSAAQEAGYSGFAPDACLINRYLPGSRMSLHQDKNEEDYSAPIVSVSLGLPMVFQFGGMARNDKPARLPLSHGDVVVWGGADRLRYHGVSPLKSGYHELTGDCRINLTFRKAGA
ncbi:MAG: DNA oxidative demethylase AlkB [Marinobacter sp.]|uniref:DNA oxidative demethylase AlkB n=1 Tax=Marinobacter sp. TaxID=50741 RepID=UPI0034A0A1DA